ncbi:histone-lysine N-methyltransferase SETD1B [Anopheles bellator]|uniref:histone-lysine N-methyltransferase SETD1B n=1 Tax=Anopheles bellator TaxID=139047 RepID=UPI002647FE38|nr:histone-lysine N-methyltransferase SETD1B [Anopheles bellator]
MPAYDSFTSSRGRTESIYYTAKEYDSADGDESDYGHGRAPPPPPPPPPHIFEDTSPTTIFNRRYVDPWDMENYVYIRKHVLDPASETSEVSPSPAGEPIQSKFYYVPGELNGLGECLECGSSAEEPEFEPEFSESELELVGQQQQQQQQHRQLLLEASDGHNSATPRMMDGMELERVAGEEPEPSELEEGDEEQEDEEDGFYTERYDTVMDEDSIGGDELVYSSYTDLETSSTEQPSSCDSSMSALRLHTPGFGKSSRRPIVLPKPLPQLEFPGPPSYEYYEPSCCYMPLPPPPPPPPPPPHHVASHYHHHPHHHHPLASPPSIAGTILSEDHHNYYTLNDCLECARQEAEHVPLYATTSSASPTRRRSRSVSVVSHSMSLARRPSQMLDPATAIAIAATHANVCYTPQHFSLSKKGLLQIDYSCNWNNLDRYIAK